MAPCPSRRPRPPLSDMPGGCSRAIPSSTATTTCPWTIRNDAKARGDVAAYDLRRPARGQTDLARLRAGGVGGQFWSVYIPGDLAGGRFARVQLEQIDIARRVIARYPERLAPAFSAADVERGQAARADRLAPRDRGRPRHRGIARRAPRLLRPRRAVHDAHPQRHPRLGGLLQRRPAPRRAHRLREGGRARDEPARHAGRPRPHLARGHGRMRSTSPSAADLLPLVLPRR